MYNRINNNKFTFKAIQYSVTKQIVYFTLIFKKALFL